MRRGTLFSLQYPAPTPPSPSFSSSTSSSASPCRETHWSAVSRVPCLRCQDNSVGDWFSLVTLYLGTPFLPLPNLHRLNLPVALGTTRASLCDFFPPFLGGWGRNWKGCRRKAWRWGFCPCHTCRQLSQGIQIKIFAKASEDCFPNLRKKPSNISRVYIYTTNNRHWYFHTKFSYRHVCFSER